MLRVKRRLGTYFWTLASARHANYAHPQEEVGAAAYLPLERAHAVGAVGSAVDMQDVALSAALVEDAAEAALLEAMLSRFQPGSSHEHAGVLLEQPQLLRQYDEPLRGGLARSRQAQTHEALGLALAPRPARAFQRLALQTDFRGSRLARHASFLHEEAQRGEARAQDFERGHGRVMPAYIGLVWAWVARH
jgi:hypothetical protein